MLTQYKINKFNNQIKQKKKTFQLNIHLNNSVYFFSEKFSNLQEKQKNFPHKNKHSGHF